MSTIVDRRGQSKNQQVNSRRRFINRNRRAVRKAMDKKIADGGIRDIGKDGVDVTVPRDGVHEPTIHHGKGGISKRVFPGNKDFQKDDQLPKPPPNGGGGGREGSPDGEGEDEFTFHLNEEEFLEFLFEDLELPNLTKVGDQDTTKTKMVPAGLSSDGPPNKMDLPRSVKQRMGRQISGSQKYKREILALKEEQRDILKTYVANDSDEPQQAAASNGDSKFVPIKTKLKQIDAELDVLRHDVGGKLSADDAQRIDDIDKDIEGLERKVGAIPKWDDKNDIVYRLSKKEPVPTSKAVMFCLMDVSASMDEETKANAKLFYFLLHRFLQRHYEQTDIVFIRHHSVAEEVDEETFFYDRETGGTVVSTAIEKMQDVIKDRYPPSEWNIYGAQATDGDNFGQDNLNVEDYLQQILPKIQAYFYTEIRTREFDRMFGADPDPEGLWGTMENVQKDFPNKFFMGLIKSRSDIFPIFREFFKRRETYDAEERPESAFGEVAP